MENKLKNDFMEKRVTFISDFPANSHFKSDSTIIRDGLELIKVLIETNCYFNVLKL